MDDTFLAERFCTLWQHCAGVDAAQVWQGLRRHYQEPHRHYHTLAHLRHCLRELDLAGDRITERSATEMAIWFHDSVYRYGARDNEILSAAYFRQVAADTMPAEFIARVSEFILATQHTSAARDTSVAYVVDIDLSGFGLPWDTYLADSIALRHEASGVSDTQYYPEKLQFLDKLRRWPSLFQTAYFRHRLEFGAQLNIARYSTELQRQGFGGDTLRVSCAQGLQETVA